MRRVTRSQTDKLKRSAWEIYQHLEEEICTKPATTVLLGDSLIQNFVHHPNLVKRLGSTANLGIGGDKIEHVLWRVKNGSFPKDCRFVILHVGTNNLKRDPPSRIVGGVRAICQAINKRHPGVKIAISSILPRGDADDLGSKITKVNSGLRGVMEAEMVIIHKAGFQQNLYRTDFIHLNHPGYVEFCDGLEKAICQVGC